MKKVRGGANPSDVNGDNGEACKNLNIRINWYQRHDICNLVCLFSVEGIFSVLAA